jgi:hypothetical protein
MTLIVICLRFTMGVGGALSGFARPFTHVGISVRPTDVDGALLRLEDTDPDQDSGPCVGLTVPELG